MSYSINDINEDVITFDEVEEKETEWIIDNLIPKGEITIIFGDGGVGKGTIAYNIISALSNGNNCFFEQNGVNRKPLKVLILSSEDDIERVIKPKLCASNANMKNTVTIKSDSKYLSNITIGSRELKDLIEVNGIDVLFLDPLQAFLEDKIDMSKRNQMRKALASLKEIHASDNGSLSTIILMHSNKRENAFGRSRMADSADIWDISRSVIIVGNVDDNTKYLSHEKSNFGFNHKWKSILFTIEKDEKNNKFVKPIFRSYSDKGDREFVLEKKKNSDDAAIGECGSAILEYLESNSDSSGEVITNELNQHLSSIGYNNSQIRKAKEELKYRELISYKQKRKGDEKNGNLHYTVINKKHNVTK